MRGLSLAKLLVLNRALSSYPRSVYGGRETTGSCYNSGLLGGMSSIVLDLPHIRRRGTTHLSSQHAKAV